MNIWTIRAFDVGPEIRPFIGMQVGLIGPKSLSKYAHISQSLYRSVRYTDQFYIIKKMPFVKNNPKVSV